MFTKLVALLVLGMSLSLGSPKISTPTSYDTKTPEALIRVCLGPMTIGLGAPEGMPVNISFDALSHEDGHAGLIHGHLSAALTPF